MKRFTSRNHTIVILFSFIFLFAGFAYAAEDPTMPQSPVKLIFIHHSCGENWLSDYHGGLGIELMNNNYFVSDTNYGWGPNSIGDRTDIGNWYEWFLGSSSSTYLSALYAENSRNSDYSRMSTDPGGENEIIMFKSCFPNSHLGGSPYDQPTVGQNPLRGMDAYSQSHTVANAKGIYNDLLTYFATKTDKLFIAITAPPLDEDSTDAQHAANARAFNNWLVNNWLSSYAHNNVAVFDFYNVLTSNGGDVETNDLGWSNGNHHRYRNNKTEHIQTVNYNMSAYPSYPGDSHPTAAGNQKATREFIDLLNIAYNKWKGGSQPPPSGWVDISGTVTYGGAPINAMVLANGEYMFTSATDGKYSLTVPYDANGEITLFGFCENLMPYRATLTSGGSGRDIQMTPCIPSKRKTDNPEMEAGPDLRAAEWVDISGYVTYDNIPLCAMVLANGQYMFTCSGDGRYDLSVPLDQNRQIILYAFCDGQMPYKITLDEYTRSHDISMYPCE